MKIHDNFSYTRTLLFLFAAIVLLTSGCGGKIDGEPPIEKIKVSLVNVPTYSIILEDMKEEGNFFKTYFHKYRIVQENEG
ncbi:MAG: hypothetical protein C0403_18120, partial [Desulfobacterium sp.]|nr:hypothetical protein [Desulfobacterium sp.]